MPHNLPALMLVAMIAAGCATPGGDVPATSPPLEGTASPPVAAETSVAAATAPEATAAPVATASPLDCSAPAAGSVELVACNVVDGLRSRNLSALHGAMADPFAFGRWRSEGIADTPANVTAQLAANHLPADPARPMTFTADRAAFAAFRDLPVESLMGPDVNVTLVLSSTGWGQDGAGEALLFFTEDDAGRPEWRGLILAPEGFE